MGKGKREREREREKEMTEKRFKNTKTSSEQFTGTLNALLQRHK